MSHAAAETCTQRLAAGRGTDGYQVTGISLDEHWTTGLAAKPLVNKQMA